MALRSFADVLNEAISDIVEHGFDSLERIDRWKRELTEAAERQAGDPEVQAQILRDALAAIYKREVEQLKLLTKHHGDVPRFTIDKVKPHLRAELDRRIQASASLIKNNREQAIAKTLQRFEGWSTSVPPGGVPGEKKSEIKADQRKALKQLPFEERRVLIDQGHKLVASLSEIVAADGGAIAGRWRSQWLRAGYDYREDHKERDDKVYLIRDSWAHQAGLVNKGGRPYYDEITAVGQEPFCSCYMVWLYNVRDLPDDMVTKAGRRKLTEIGMHTNASRAFARTDDADTTFLSFGVADEDHDAAIGADVIAQVIRSDRLGYHQGVRGFEFTPDTDRWNASEEHGIITLQEKFRALPAVEQAHILLHELGHVGQETDRATWQDFLTRHEARLSAFEAMANPQHMNEWRRRGQVTGGIASEVFAESYARFCLGHPVPSHLADFWRSRIDGLLSQRDARYLPWWPDRPTRCIRCSMFQPGLDPRTNTCTAVSGDIAMSGHCRLFEIKGARTDSASSQVEEIKPKVGYEAHRMRLERLQRQAEALREDALSK